MAGPIVAVPNIFVNGTVAEAPDVNTDFQSLVDQVNNLFPLATNLGGTGSATFSAFTVLAQQVITTTGTYTPTAGMKYCIVEIVGGGGGGVSNTGSGRGGGAGEYARGVFTAAQIGAGQTGTIGAAGAAGSSSSGGVGGTTSLGSLLTAVGGGGTGIGGTGGTGTGLHVHGGSSPGTIGSGFGSGGSSFFGSGGSASTSLAEAGVAYGSGGGAGPTAAAGAPGVIIITEFA